MGSGAAELYRQPDGLCSVVRWSLLGRGLTLWAGF